MFVPPEAPKIQIPSRKIEWGVQLKRTTSTAKFKLLSKGQMNEEGGRRVPISYLIVRASSALVGAKVVLSLASGHPCSSKLTQLSMHSRDSATDLPKKGRRVD